MRKLMIILATILVVLVLMFGGIWGYLWYSTQQQVKEWVVGARPLAQISYDSIEVLPSGSVGIKQIKIIPNFINDVISIGAIRLNAPNLLALLNIRRLLSEGQFPDAMSLSIRGLELPLHGGILGAKPPTPQERVPFDDLDTLGCGSIIHFSGNEWQEMGYENFISHLATGYRLDSTHNRIDLHINSSTQDWVTLNLEIGLTLNTPVTSIMELTKLLTPKLASLNMVIQDDGYNTHRNNYCATKAGKLVNEYIADHVRLVVERLRANGINPGSGLITAYQHYLMEGGTLTLTANSPMPIDPAELPSYRAEDVVKLAGLTLKVNDQVVNDLRVEWNTAQVVKALGIGVQRTSRAEETEEIVAPVAPKPVVIEKSFHPIAVSELNRYVSKIVKLKTSTGIHYQGQVNAVAEGIVKITIRKAGGTATLSLRSEEIAEAQVFY